MDILICLLLINIFTIEVTVAYRKYYVEDECVSPSNFQKIIYRLPGSGPDSVGELRPNRFGTYSRTGRKCLVQLIPPPGHGVLATVLKVDLRNSRGCQDYIKISDSDEDGEKLCGFNRIGKDGKVFFAEKEMKILYHTSEGGVGFSSGFKLVFTVTKLDESSVCTSPNEFKCDNSRCIWAGAVCDGINNCGDSSDENSFLNCDSEMTPIAIAAIVLGVLTFTCIAAIMCICCCRAQPVKPQKLLLDHILLRPKVEYAPLPGYIPLPGYSYGAVDNLNIVYNDNFETNLNTVDSLAPRTTPSAPPRSSGSDGPFMTHKIEIRYDEPPPYKP